MGGEALGTRLTFRVVITFRPSTTIRTTSYLFVSAWIGVIATSSPGRFSLALEVAFSRPTSKAREERPGDEVGVIDQAPYVNFPKISVWKTISDLEFSELLLQNFSLACLS